MRIRSLFSGASALAMSSIVRIAIQIAILPIIGRIIGPTAYGEFALVSPFIVLSMVLSESGLGACLNRAETLTPALEGTVFTFSIAVSCVAILIFGVFGRFAGALLSEPNFFPLLMGVSVVLLISSFSIVPSNLLLRMKRFDLMALGDIASSAGSIVGVLIGIWLDWGVWSLVAQQIAFWTCKFIVVTIGVHWRPYFIFSWAAFKENIHFGSNLTGASIVGFLSSNIDNILIGGLMGPAALGHYALAWQINSLPPSVLGGSLYYSIFSTTSELDRTKTFTPRPFLRSLKGILLISAPASAGLALTAGLTIPLIVGNMWLPAVSIIQCLSVMGFCVSIDIATSALLIGRGRTDISLKLGLTGSLMKIAAILIGVLISPQAIAMGLSVAAAINLYITLRAVVSVAETTWHAILNLSIAPVVATFLMGVTVYLFQTSFLLDSSYFVRLIASAAIGAGSYGVVLVTLFHKETLADIVNIKATLMPKRSGQQEVP